MSEKHVDLIAVADNFFYRLLNVTIVSMCAV